MWFQSHDWMRPTQIHSLWLWLFQIKSHQLVNSIKSLIVNLQTKCEGDRSSAFYKIIFFFFKLLRKVRGKNTCLYESFNPRNYRWKVTSWRLDFGTWVRDCMNFATKWTSWQAYALKDTLTVTNLCHEVIHRSREVTDCPEHALVTNLFVANNRRLYTVLSWKYTVFRA